LKGALPAYQTQQEATNRFFLAAIIQSDAVVDFVRKELRRFAPEVKVLSEDIKANLINNVLKREVVEGDKATEARKRIHKMTAKLEKAKIPKEVVNSTPNIKPEDNLRSSTQDRTGEDA
jgi:hypothetical protein